MPLGERIDDFYQREIVPHVPDAWIDTDKTKIGYEISFNKQFYEFKAPRSLTTIDSDLRKCTASIKLMIDGLTS